MSQVLVVSEEVVRSMAATIASLQCDVATYKSAYDALAYTARMLISKRLLMSQISPASCYSVVCSELLDSLEKSKKIIADRAADVDDDDLDYCCECCEPLSPMSQRAGRCLNCVK